MHYYVPELSFFFEFLTCQLMLFEVCRLQMYKNWKNCFYQTEQNHIRFRAIVWIAELHKMTVKWEKNHWGEEWDTVNIWAIEIPMCNVCGRNRTFSLLINALNSAFSKWIAFVIFFLLSLLAFLFLTFSMFGIQNDIVFPKTVE